MKICDLNKTKSFLEIAIFELLSGFSEVKISLKTDVCTPFHGRQISVHTRELAPETGLCNRFAPGACSLISNQFDLREQNSRAKVLLRNIFSLESVGGDEGALLRERVAGACGGSKLPCVYRL